MPGTLRRVVRDFGRGIVDNIPADQLPAGAVVAALNVELDRRSNLRTRNGCRRLNWSKNLLGDIQSELDAAGWTWADSGSVDEDAVDGVTGEEDGDLLLDDDAATVSELRSDTFTTEAGEKWTGAVYFRVPEDYGDGDATMPAIGLRFGSLVAVGGVLIPDTEAEHGWTVRRIGDAASFPVAWDIGEVVPATDEEGWNWFQVYVTAVVPADETAVQLVLIPAFNTYEHDAGILTAVNGLNTDGTIDRDVAAESDVGVATWGAVLERGKFTPRRPSTTGSAADLDEQYLNSRVTSIYQYRTAEDSSAILVTSGAHIYRYNATEGWLDQITGELTIPEDTLWQWVTYDGIAIGANGAELVKLETPSGEPALLEGTPPDGKYLAVWNDRIWTIDAEEPWILRGSALGLPEDWTDTDPVSGSVSVEVGGQENHDCTGIFPDGNRLLVFKRDRIYQIVPGSPNTDISQYEVRLVRAGTGCVSGFSIRALMNDVTFLSPDGWTTLSAVEKYGGGENGVLSRDLRDFRRFENVIESAVSEVYPTKSQVLMSFRTRLAAANDLCYVLDYTDFDQGRIAFTRFSGPPCSSAYGRALIAGEERLLLGTESDSEDGSNAYVYLHDEQDQFDDEGEAYPISIRTAAFSMAGGDLFSRKRLHHWEALFELLSETASVTITWRSDLREGATDQTTVDMEGQLPGGGLWDEMVWDADIWAGESPTNNVFVQRHFIADSAFPRIVRTIQAEISQQDSVEGWTLKALLLTADFVEDVPGISLGEGLTGQEMVTEEGLYSQTVDGRYGVREAS